MNSFSLNVYESLQKKFPEWLQYANVSEDCLVIDIPANKETSIGGLIIQTTEDNDIWIRNYHAYSGYLVDSVEELVNIVTGILSDEILWVIGLANGVWSETTLVEHTSQVKKNPGIKYQILSWSGALDEVL